MILHTFGGLGRPYRASKDGLYLSCGCLSGSKGANQLNENTFLAPTRENNIVVSISFSIIPI